MTRATRRNTNVRPTDDELLDAVLVVVAESGLAASTMEEIAEKADTTKPTLYAHFGNKDALIDRVQQRELDLLRTRLFAAYDALDPRADLLAFMTACVEPLYDYAEERPDGIKVIMDDSSPRYYERGKEFFAQILERTTRHAALAQAMGPEYDEANLVISAMIVAAAIDGNRVALNRGTSRDVAVALTASFLAGGFERSAITALQQHRGDHGAAVESNPDTPSA